MPDAHPTIRLTRIRCHDDDPAPAAPDGWTVAARARAPRADVPAVRNDGRTWTGAWPRDDAGRPRWAHRTPWADAGLTGVPA